MTTVAVLGAGAVGGNLGVRLASCGHDVRFGVRSAALGSAATAALVARCGGRGAAFEVAAAVRGAAIVFLCVGSEQAIDVAREAAIGDAIVVDCTNPIRFEASGPFWDPPAEGSTAAALTAALPAARVVKGFCSFGAALHATATVAGQPVDVPVAGDDAAAKDAVAALARSAGFAPWDAGPLAAAALLENLAVLWIRRAQAGLGTRFAFQPVVDPSG